MTKKFGSAAFDVLAVGGKELRKLPLSMRKMDLEQLLARRPEGVFINPWRVAMAHNRWNSRGVHLFSNYSTRCTFVGWPGVPAYDATPVLRAGRHGKLCAWASYARAEAQSREEKPDVSKTT
jgi:hypothetical protein